MIHNEFNLYTQDCQQLFAQSWEPDNKNAKAIIILIHGLGEHSSRFEHMASFFVKHDIAVMGCDLRGHGRSEGRRGYAPSYNTLLKDIDVLIQNVCEHFPTIPKILYGHSLGGNLGINYIISRMSSIKGLIATSPWLRLSEEPSTMLTSIAKKLVKVYPFITNKTGLNPRYMSHNAEEVRKYKEDKLVHNKIGVKLFFEIQEAGRTALRKKQKINVPFLLMHGANDKITSPKASLELADNMSSNVTFRLWERLYHEMHNEDVQKEYFNYIYNWINEVVILKSERNIPNSIKNSRI
jgi:acylglycerol lipase